MISLELKGKVMSRCVEIAERRAEELQSELVLIQESANSETKSSMGDKYETGREMLMQERSKVEQQLQLTFDQLRIFKSIDTSKAFDKVELGALVGVQNAVFFVGAAMGAIEVDGMQVFVVSAMAPVVQAMLGKSEGDTYIFNGKKSSILKLL